MTTATAAPKGLSPRVRGNPALSPVGSGAYRSIPACAGEPSGLTPIPKPEQVYPRVCGGTQHQIPGQQMLVGLSPRVRGNPVNRGAVAMPVRSIPACAGEPPGGNRPLRRPEVYPRVCGGTAPPTARHPRPAGLSPRVRGNPGAAIQVVNGRRSIPACAGEPVIQWLGQGPVQGLSPRVRGNPSVPSPVIVSSGSIPACAGEPFSRNRLQHCVRGLSPRVRGNPSYCLQLWILMRSIPACAGEPSPIAALALSPPVYPRVCGGTRLFLELLTDCGGLSPRVRGNRCRGRGSRPSGRSIPACAGEPTAGAVNCPRVRSIPACAGEPVPLTGA